MSLSCPSFPCLLIFDSTIIVEYSILVDMKTDPNMAQDTASIIPSYSPLELSSLKWLLKSLTEPPARAPTSIYTKFGLFNCGNVTLFRCVSLSSCLVKLKYHT